MGWWPQLWLECDPHSADNQPAKCDTPHIWTVSLNTNQILDPSFGLKFLHPPICVQDLTTLREWSNSSNPHIFVCLVYKTETKGAFLRKKSRPEFLIAATGPSCLLSPSPVWTSTALGRKNRMVWVPEFLTHAPPLIAGTNAAQARGTHCG